MNNRETECKATRRDVLKWTCAAGASLALPGTVFGEAPEEITLLYASGGPEIMWSPNHIAEAQGYYKDEGLTIKRVYSGSGPAGMAALVSGSGKDLFCPPGELLVAASRGQKFKILMSQSNYVPLFFLVSKEFAEKNKLSENMSLEQKIAAARNFKGIRCGVTSPGSMTDYFARKALEQSGIDPSVDAQVVPMGSVQNAVAAMSRGTVDAVVSSALSANVGITQFGAVPFFTLSKGEVSGFSELSGHLIQARASDIEEQRDVYQAIVRAETRGFRFITENPKEAGEILHKAQYSTTNPDFWRAVWEANITQFKTPYVTQDSVAAWIKLGLVKGVKDVNAVNVLEIVDMTFVDKAVQDINWKIPT